MTDQQPRPNQQETEQPRTGRDSGVGPVSGEGNLVLVSPQGPMHISMSGSGSGPEVVGDVTTHDTPDSTRTPQETVWEKDRRDAAQRRQEDLQRLVQQAAEATGQSEHEVLQDVERTQQRLQAARQGDVTPHPNPRRANNADRATDRARRNAERDRARTRNRGTNSRTIDVTGDGHITITGRDGDVTP